MATPAPKTLILNDDGWSMLMRYPAPMGPAEIEAATVGRVAGTGVRIYQFCPLGGHVVNYRSSWLPRVGASLGAVRTMHVWRMLETLRHLDALGTDPLEIVGRACERAGIECQFSLRVNDAHHVYRLPDGSPYFPELQSPWLAAHPELLLPNGQLDYEHLETHAYRLRQIAEVLERYPIAGVDLDFTRIRPWFRVGREALGRPLMTQFMRRVRELASASGRRLSARFEYDHGVMIASGLDLESWLAEGLLDQITLGVVGDHTPDASASWWIERAHAAGCRVFPGVEGQLHWCPGCGAGGTGIRPGEGDVDGFGPPSLEYLRAAAAVHYEDGADGLSLFNLTCADGPLPARAFDELACPDRLRGQTKRYVYAVWPQDRQIFYEPWTSLFRLEPGQASATWPLRTAAETAPGGKTSGPHAVVLTLDLKGTNRIDDVAVDLNGTEPGWTGYHYNHYDHGCWTDIVQFAVPPAALRPGTNELRLSRRRATPGFQGAIEVRKCLLDVVFPERQPIGRCV